MQGWETSWLAPLCQKITHFWHKLRLCILWRDPYLDEVFDD
jgi:hypothetical protein